MYSSLPHFFIGFHGCDKTVADSVVTQQCTNLISSKNKWDWLGNGVYFWEQNYHRAIDWAKQLMANPDMMPEGSKPIKTPAAVGAVIDLGRCLNLLDGQSIALVQGTYTQINKIFEAAKFPLPTNKGNAHNLDCVVINAVNMFLASQKKKKYDTVRCLFSEGNPIYENSCFMEKNHVQICVINPNCIKGYFHPMKHNPKYPYI